MQPLSFKHHIYLQKIENTGEMNTSAFLFVCFSYCSGRISKVNLETSHSSDDGNNGLDGVAIDHSLVLLTLLL